MSKYVATRNVHHDGRAFKAGELIDFDDKDPQHELDISGLIQAGAIKPSEELAALLALNLDQLKELATAEQVPVPEGVATKAGIASVVIAHRAHLAEQPKVSTEE